MRNVLILTVLFAFLALPARAGECPKMKAHKEAMQKLLTGELGLDAAKAEKVGAILHDYFTAKKAAGEEKHQAFEALKKLVEAKEAKIEVYEAALKRLKDARDGMTTAKKAKCDGLGALLDARQRATLMVHMADAHGEGHHGKMGCGCKDDCGCKGDCGCKKDGDKPCGCKGDGTCKKDGDKGACGCGGDTAGDTLPCGCKKGACKCGK